MPKPKRGGSSRRQPEPVDDHAVIEEWLARTMPGLQPIVACLDEAIRQALPDAHFAVKWRKAYYGLPGLGWVIELAAYDVSANIVFLAGASFDSPPPLGEGDASRYVKVRSVEEASTAAIARWIVEAGQTPGWR